MTYQTDSALRDSTSVIHAAALGYAQITAEEDAQERTQRLAATLPTFEDTPTIRRRRPVSQPGA
jgi:hypothetical protein